MQAEKAISSTLVDIKLPANMDVGDRITECSYVKHVLEFLQSCFKVSLETVTKLRAEKIWTEVLLSKDNHAMLSLRLYDRRQEDHGDFLLTLTLETTPGQVKGKVYDSLAKFCDEERARLSAELDGTKPLAPNQELLHLLPNVSRGSKYNPHYRTSDDRFCHYNILDVVYDVRSKYQHVQILDTIDAGKLLVLDGYTNFAESDTVGYTHALMDVPRELSNYAGARVLILGGGDGALLKELLEIPSPPAEVIMVDLDEAVMSGCREHMRSVCGPYLDHDRRKGPNYRVICGDAIEYMEKEQGGGNKFDFVFGDLTDTPVDPDETDGGASADLWKFLRRIITLAVNVLKPKSGKYLTHYNGKSVSGLISKYEELLHGLRVEEDLSLRPQFTRTSSFVPSFQEVWIFYQISMV